VRINCAGNDLTIPESVTGRDPVLRDERHSKEADVLDIVGLSASAVR